jgi:hypothetical protein
VHLVTKGTLFRVHAATSKWTRVSSITGTGIYQAVFRSSSGERRLRQVTMAEWV